MSLCENCIKGVTHEGTPIGKIEKIGGVDTYVVKPEGEYAKDKAILYLPDVFGLPIINAKLLADDFARNGYQVYIPDYLNDDPIPADALNDGKFDLMGWLSKHGSDVTRPLLDKVIAGLKEQGITTFAATGYCFGGRYVWDLALENVIKVGATSHPSLIKVPEDLEKLVATSKVPLLINSAEIDEMYGPTQQAKGDEILGDGKYAPGYKRTYYPGTTHGFAVRGDMSDPKVKAGKEGAFTETVAWFQKYL